jgi:hypothetical protein
MTYKEAKHYIFMSVKEGYMSDEEGVRVLSLPREEMIAECERLGAEGDAHANALRKGEL